VALKYPIEIEFVCANSEYPKYREIQSKHVKLNSRLAGENGVYPYRQNNSDPYHKEFSFAVAVANPTAKQLVLKGAKRIGLKVDIVDDISQRKVDRIVRKEIQNQMRR